MLINLDEVVKYNQSFCYLFFRAGQEIVSKSVTMTHEEDVCVLTVEKTPADYTGEFMCVAVNSAGQASCAATVTVESKNTSILVFLDMAGN